MACLVLRLMHLTVIPKCFQIKMDKHSGFEVIHSKPLHRHNSRKVNGTDMQSTLEGIFF